MSDKFVCPSSWSWILLFGRKLFHDPDKILGGIVKEGMAVADIGCGAGYFTVALSGLAGPSGKVYAVDIQQKMLDKTAQRVSKLCADKNVTFVKAGDNSLNLPSGLDFALAFFMIHEVPDISSFFNQAAKALKPGGKLLVSEPYLHATKKDLQDEADAATKAGFKAIPAPHVFFGHTFLLEKIQDK